MLIRVCMLTSVHSPLDQRIFAKEARTLSSAGYEVTVVGPGNGTIAGRREGITILTLPIPRGLIGRAVNLMRLFVIGWRSGSDIYHFHDPELLPVGVLLCLLGKRVVYDVHEHFPQVAYVRSWIPSALRPAVSVTVDIVERFLACCFSAVVGVVDEQEQRFSNCLFAAIKNYPRVECFAGDSRPEQKRVYGNGAAELIHVGSLSAERGGLFLLDIMRELRPFYPNVRLKSLGPFHSETIRREFQTRLEKFELGDSVTVETERVAYEKLGQVIRGGIVGLIPGQVSAQNLTPFIPTKLFEYMACGLPVVASALPSIRQFYLSADWGMLVEPGDPKAHALAIAHLLEHPEEARKKGTVGREAVEKTFNWDGEAEKLLELYARIDGAPEHSISEPTAILVHETEEVRV